jgi:hypothetical protein
MLIDPLAASVELLSLEAMMILSLQDVGGMHVMVCS